MKIVLITIGQPSTNPRLVKEASALANAGHEVIVLYCFWIDWAFRSDKKLLADVKWKFELVGGCPYANSSLFWYTKIKLKTFEFLNKWIGNKYGIAEIAQAKGYSQLLQRAKSIKADWYIGHILGSLPIAVNAALYNNAKAGFDFEDYHRAENKPVSKVDVSRITYLENKYVPLLNYISTASPLITDQVRLNFPIFINTVITINNTFSKKDQLPFIKKNSNDNSLQLFWFSQTVGPDRGIEILLDALAKLADKEIFLTLIGKYTKDIEESFLRRAGEANANIYFKGVVDPDNIAIIAATMDVGLALEQTIPYNRDICLTNKIFTYLQCGNALILTNTKAQKQFQEQYNVGAICNIGDVNGICTILKEYKSNRNLLDQQKEKNWHLANELLNWENESKKLLAIIQ